MYKIIVYMERGTVYGEPRILLQYDTFALPLSGDRLRLKGTNPLCFDTYEIKKLEWVIKCGNEELERIEELERTGMAGELTGTIYALVEIVRPAEPARIR